MGSERPQLTVGSLFAGIGGFDLAATRVFGPGSVRWQVELDPWCRQVLAKHWPDVPKFADIREVTGDELEPVELVCGGFPCQDTSKGNPRGLGLAGERSGLWTEYARLLGVLRPRYAVVENVPKLFDRGFERLLSDLAALGFDAEWHCIPASAIGAPHVRDRLWIVAYAQCPVLWSARCGETARAPRGVPFEARERERLWADAGTADFSGVWAGSHPEPGIRRLADGVSDGVVRTQNRGYGNAIVPQVAEFIFRLILQAEEVSSA